MKLARFALLAALAVTGCQAALPHAVPATVRGVRALDAGDLYPLVAGRHWAYDLAQQQDNGPVQQHAMTIAITSVTAVSPGLAEAVLDRDYGGFKPPSTRVRKSADAVVLSRLSDPVDGPSITILRFPLTPGTSWPGRDFGGGNTETIAPQGPESVTVPAGTYTAQRVDHHIHYAQGGDDTLSYWYASGVGVVKMIERITVWQGTQAVHMASTGTLKAMTDGLTSSGNGAGSAGTGPGAWGFLAAPGGGPRAGGRW